jgi:uncharacterized protein (TIGR03000 family)
MGHEEATMTRLIDLVRAILAVTAAGILLGGANGAARAQYIWGSKMWPYNVHGYNYSGQGSMPAPASPAPSSPPRRWDARFAGQASGGVAQARTPDSVLVIAHVPKDATISFADRPTEQRGEVRRFESPALARGKTYTYSVRVAWNDNGQSVTKTKEVPVHAGDVVAVEVGLSPGALQAGIDANLAALSAADRALAQAQRFDPILQNVRLGALGVPVKLSVKGQPVFVACADVEDKALVNPDELLAKLEALKATLARGPADAAKGARPAPRQDAVTKPKAKT